ncbi:MAG: hypothetical protein Q9181_007711 [Wetmoreana brouardii]
MADSWGQFHGRELTDQERETFYRLFPNAKAGENLELKDYHYRLKFDDRQTLDARYFESLVSLLTSAENLPRFGLPSDNDDANPGVNVETIPLYGVGADGRVLQPKGYTSGEGMVLAYRVLSNMSLFHSTSRLQHELRMMLDQKTTSNEQMERVHSILVQYEKVLSIRHLLQDQMEYYEDHALRALVGKQTDSPTVSRRQSDDVWIAMPEPAMPETMESYNRSRGKDRLARKFEMKSRLLAAVFGGLSLVGPMLIMAIRPSQVKTLITSSAAVLLFSLGLACTSSAKTETLLGTTAAYAAVMVVFVGLNTK